MIIKYIYCYTYIIEELTYSMIRDNITKFFGYNFYSDFLASVVKT